VQHYRLDTYHGPVVLIQRPAEWEIRSSGVAPEVYAGQIPFWCLARAREISATDAARLLADAAEADEGWASPCLERAS
jgi:hypothetical protein